MKSEESKRGAGKNTIYVFCIVLFMIVGCITDTDLHPISKDRSKIKDSIRGDISVATIESDTLFLVVKDSKRTPYLDVWFKIQDWQNLQGFDFQPNEMEPNFGYSVEIQVRDSCENTTEIISDHQLWSNDLAEMTISDGNCLYIGAVWWYESAYCDDGQEPLKIGFYSSPQDNTSDLIEICPFHCGAGYCWIELSIPIKLKYIIESQYYDDDTDQDSLSQDYPFEVMQSIDFN